MKHIKAFENYRFFDEKNIGDIVTCYQLPSYGFHTLKIGKKYEIVDIRTNGYLIDEIKVKPIEPIRGEVRYYSEVYFLTPEEKLKKQELNRAANKYNL
jgi:hypothetical protein